MEFLNTPYLCGGVVVSLIVLVKSKGIPRKRRQGEKDFNSNPQIMLTLEKAIDPHGTYFPSSTHDKDTSNYLNCKEPGDTNGIVFNSAVFAQQFDEEIKKQNPAPVERMAEFLDMFLPENYRLWLLKAVLEILESDPSINEDTEFYINGNGTATTKAVIRKTTDFSLEAFLTGIFHFVLTNRCGHNYLGADTISSCNIKKLAACTLGRGIAREINMVPWVAEHSEEPSATPISTPQEASMSATDVIAAHAAKALLDFAKVAPQIIRERAEELQREDAANQQEACSDDSDGATIPEPEICYEIPKRSGEQVTYINHQTNVYQNAGPGGKNIHIEHVEKLEL